MTVYDMWLSDVYGKKAAQKAEDFVFSVEGLELMLGVAGPVFPPADVVSLVIDLAHEARILDESGDVAETVGRGGSGTEREIVESTKDLLAKIKNQEIELHELASDKQMKIAQELKTNSPVQIPDEVVPEIRYTNGYDQIKYKWNDGIYTYEIRWHTATPDAPGGTPPNWRVDRKISGTPGGKNPITGIKIQGMPAIKEVLIAPPGKSSYYISRDT